ncbi:MAG TPA: NUDIX domain-containing protein [Patescibacteria group bacterium]
MRVEKVLPKAVVVFLRRNGKVLLAIKMDKIGKGCYNGYGGGLENEDNGSLRKAAVRETREETRKERTGIIIKPEDLIKRAIINCHNMKSDGSTFICELHVFEAYEFSGEAEDTEEMVDAAWFLEDMLPKTMPCDPDWLGLILKHKDKKFRANTFMGPFQKEKIRETEIWEVDDLSDD